MDLLRTFGHGMLTADDIIDLLRASGVSAVADVRRFPGSRRHPHVNREAMEAWLPAVGVAYRWIPALGGRRKPDPASRHVGLRNDQFRAYADHMATDEFSAGLAELDEVAAEAPVAVMCSESVWWRCHRRLLADHLVLVEGTEVEHVFHDGRHSPHPPMPEARVADGVVVYDVVDQPRLFEG